MPARRAAPTHRGGAPRSLLRRLTLALAPLDGGADAANATLCADSYLDAQRAARDAHAYITLRAERVGGRIRFAFWLVAETLE